MCFSNVGVSFFVSRRKVQSREYISRVLDICRDLGMVAKCDLGPNDPLIYFSKATAQDVRGSPPRPSTSPISSDSLENAGERVFELPIAVRSSHSTQ